MSGDPIYSNPQKARENLRSECGLDAFAQPAEVWLSIAVAAEARGELQYAKHCERAMEISLRRWGETSP